MHTLYMDEDHNTPPLHNTMHMHMHMGACITRLAAAAASAHQGFLSQPQQAAWGPPAPLSRWRARGRRQTLRGSAGQQQRLAA
jgi:hypothetical protein